MSKMKYYLIPVLILIIAGCGRSAFEEKYEQAEDAYMSDNLKYAEETLLGFDEFLEQRIDQKESPDDYLIQSRLLTNIRLYEIYQYLNRTDLAQSKLLIIKSLEGAESSEDGIRELISEVESDPSYRPAWKD